MFDVADPRPRGPSSARSSRPSPTSSSRATGDTSSPATTSPSSSGTSTWNARRWPFRVHDHLRSNWRPVRVRRHLRQVSVLHLGRRVRVATGSCGAQFRCFAQAPLRGRAARARTRSGDENPAETQTCARGGDERRVGVEGYGRRVATVRGGRGRLEAARPVPGRPILHQNFAHRGIRRRTSSRARRPTRCASST